MDKEQLKVQISIQLKTYLTKLGWPDKIDNNRIIQELPNMWKLLEEKGLAQECAKHGLGFRKFADSAIRKMQEIEILDQMFGAGWGRR